MRHFPITEVGRIPTCAVWKYLLQAGSTNSNTNKIFSPFCERHGRGTGGGACRADKTHRAMGRTARSRRRRSRRGRERKAYDWKMRRRKGGWWFLLLISHLHHRTHNCPTRAFIFQIPRLNLNGERNHPPGARPLLTLQCPGAAEPTTQNQRVLPKCENIESTAEIRLLSPLPPACACR